jgi:DNA-binding HxlR family transcriptional regulator
MSVPARPGRRSRTGRPIMALLDLMGRRWTMRIVWELRDGALGFRELQARCDEMSPSVLNQRLAELEAARIAARDDAGAWTLTPPGRELLRRFLPVVEWAESWAAGLRRPSGRRGA